MIAPRKIEYNNKSNDDFNLLCDVAFDGDSGDMTTFLTREAVASETYRGDFKRVHTYKYTETLAPTLTFVKSGFTNFTLEEQREVLKWLTSKRSPSWLTVYHINEDDKKTALTDDDISYEILGAFTEINTYKLGNGRVVGITAVFESIAPYAFSKLQQTEEIDVSNPTDNQNSITFEIETDEPEALIYPCITIKHKDTVIVNIAQPFTEQTQHEMILDTIYFCNSDQRYYWQEPEIDEETEKQKIDADGKLKWTLMTNSEKPDISDNKNYTSVAIQHSIKVDDDEYQDVTSVKVAHNTPGGTIIIDGANRLIFDNTSTSTKSRVFGDDFSWNWIGFREGTNKLSFIGNCTATIAYREPIKCGEI